MQVQVAHMPTFQKLGVRMSTLDVGPPNIGPSNIGPPNIGPSNQCSRYTPTTKKKKKREEERRTKHSEQTGRTNLKRSDTDQ